MNGIQIEINGEPYNGFAYQSQNGILIHLPGLQATHAHGFEALFQPVPEERARSGFIEIGEWNGSAYPFEGDCPLQIGPDGAVWAKVCDRSDDLPLALDEPRAWQILAEADDAFGAKQMAQECASCGNWPAPTTIPDFLMYIEDEADVQEHENPTDPDEMIERTVYAAALRELAQELRKLGFESSLFPGLPRMNPLLTDDQRLMALSEKDMKLNISQPTLAAGLNLAARLASARSTLPVLANVLLTADESGLHLAATDLEVSLTLHLEAQAAKPGAISVPARTFADLVNTFPQAPVELALKKDKLEVACGQSKATLNGVPASEFPPLPVAQIDQGLTLPAQALKALLQQVVFAASGDASRVTLTGVLLTIDAGALTLAAADGFRLSECKLALPEAAGKSLSCLIPARAMSELSRLLGEAEQVTLAPTHNKGQIAFVFPGSTLVSQLIEGNYPDYRQIIPRRHEVRAVLPTAALLTACKQAEIFSRENGRSARLSIRPGELQVSGHSDESGSTGSKLEAQVEGGELEIVFNVAFLREALQSMRTPSVAIECTAPNSPGAFRPVGDEQFTHVIMPMHLPG